MRISHDSKYGILYLKFGDECIVVSEEKPSSNCIGGKPKIPHVYYSYGVKHLSILELSQNEGWTF
jgi:hypothetical protein